ncbi:MAG: class I tRNA ligase family protein, partial [Candidatus Phytoplasma australasiaticum]|nr:class I tRNA ligase family protein [Candidatus Phytoplasma australasiaticum]
MTLLMGDTFKYTQSSTSNSKSLLLTSVYNFWRLWAIFNLSLMTFSFFIDWCTRLGQSTQLQITSVATFNKAAYRQIITHGFVLDGKGQKMSKSKNNII